MWSPRFSVWQTWSGTIVITYLREGVQGTATFTVSTPSEVQ